MMNLTRILAVLFSMGYGAAYSQTVVITEEFYVSIGTIEQDAPAVINVRGA